MENTIEISKQLLRSNNFNEAISLLTPLIDSDPLNDEAYRLRAFAYFMSDEYGLAKVDFYQSIDINSNNIKSLDGLLQLLVHLEEFHDAKTIFNNIIHLGIQYDGIPSVYHNGSYTFFSLNEFEKATIYSDLNYEYFKKRLEDNSVANINLDNSYWNMRGAIKLNTGNFEEAERCLNRALAFQCEGYMHQTYHNLGRLKRMQMQFELALEYINKGILLKPDYSEGYMERAVTYLKVGNDLAALADFNTVIELNPIHNLAYSNRADVKFLLNLKEQALKDLEISLTLNPAEEYTYRISAKIKYFGNKDFNSSIEDCKKAIELDPKSKEGYLLLGEIYNDHDINNIQNVIACNYIAHSLDSINAEYFLLLGNNYNTWVNLKESFDSIIDFLENQSGIKVKEQINGTAFLAKSNLAKGYLSKAFAELMPYLRTDLDTNTPNYYLHLFIGNENNIISTLKNKSIFFGDANRYSDKTSDCVILQSNFNTNLPIKISYENVRIACLCNIIKGEIVKLHTMWDRYANKHQGVALKLKITKNWILENDIYTNSVKYKDSNTSTSDSAEQAIEDGLFTKHIDYSDEREWQMMKFGFFENNEPIFIPWEIGEKKGIVLEEIYLGMEISQGLQNNIFDLLKNEKCSIYKMNLSISGVFESSKLR